MYFKKLNSNSIGRFLKHLKGKYPGTTWEKSEKLNGNRIYIISVPEPLAKVEIEICEQGSLVHLPSELWHFNRLAYEEMQRLVAAYLNK